MKVKLITAFIIAIAIVVSILFLDSQIKKARQQGYAEGFQASYVMRCKDYCDKKKKIVIAGASGEGRRMDGK